MERRFEYPVQIEQDSAGFYLVTFPDFPEAATDARSIDAAIAEGVDCLREAIAARMKRGEDIPRSLRTWKGDGADNSARSLCDENCALPGVARGANVAILACCEAGKGRKSSATATRSEAR
jgi:predicted RNase H-like HicB family nuclease